MSKIRACEILSSVEALAHSPKRWTKGAYERPDGSHCLYGLVSKVGVMHGDMRYPGFVQDHRDEPYGNSIKYIKRAIRAHILAEPLYRWEDLRKPSEWGPEYDYLSAPDVVAFNDHRDTTIEDIREVLRIARMACYAEAIFNLK